MNENAKKKQRLRTQIPNEAERIKRTHGSWALGPGPKTHKETKSNE